MKITVDEARPYFAHKSQQSFGITENDLPDWMEYRAEGNVCLAFQSMPWPGVWMVHIMVKPDAWGNTTDPAKRLLHAFWNEAQAAHVVTWIPTNNRAAIALARRVGGRLEGQMANGIDMYGWRPEWASQVQ